MSVFGCANDEQFEREIGVSRDDWLQGVLEDPYRNDKCDYCNCALRDCSLCDYDEE